MRSPALILMASCLMTALPCFTAMARNVCDELEFAQDASGNPYDQVSRNADGTYTLSSSGTVDLVCDLDDAHSLNFTGIVDTNGAAVTGVSLKAEDVTVSLPISSAQEGETDTVFDDTVTAIAHPRLIYSSVTDFATTVRIQFSIDAD